MSDKDTIYRQDAINAADRADYTGLAIEDVKKVTDEVVKELKQLPSAESIITLEQAIDYLHKIGWLQNHDRILTESKIVPTVRQKRGKWIERESDTEDKENGFETVIVCSRCDYPATTFYSEDCESRTQIRTAFCPTCGADMRGNEDGTD